MRQIVFLSLVVLVAPPLAHAQQFPNYRDGSEGGQNAWPAYAQQMPYNPGYGYYGGFYPPSPAYYPVAYSPYNSQSYYAPVPYYGGGYYPAPNAPAGYPPAPQDGPPPAPSLPPEGMPAAVPPQDWIPPEYFLPPPPAGAPADKLPRPHSPGAEKIGWISASYLASWLRPSPLNVPLVTTGPASNPLAGEIGQPGTIVLFGDKNISYGMQSGIQWDAGLWLDCNNEYSVELAGFALFPAHQNLDFASGPTGSPVLFRPFFDVVNQLESGELVSFPGFAAGSSTVRTEQEALGAELNGVYHMYCSPRLEVDALMGFRYLHLRESLQITDRFMPLVANVFTFQGQLLNPGDQETDVDSFITRNDFYGFQVGGKVHREFGPFYAGEQGKIPYRFYLDVFGKVAVGLNDELVSINGKTTATVAGATTTVPGGILALPSNIGDHHHTTFGVAPEAGLNFGVEISRHWRIETGYSFLVWSAVARPGSQINRNVNPAQVPSDINFANVAGPAAPSFANHQDLLWIQNFHFGVEYRY